VHTSSEFSQLPVTNALLLTPCTTEQSKVVLLSSAIIPTSTGCAF
jgi:hypothetical protein